MALAMPVKYGPAQLEDAPLPAAVRRLLERLASETGLRTDLEVTGDPLLAATAVDVAVLRLVQGALANVRQHALATRVVVSLSYAPDELLVDVVDDGSGFDPAATPRQRTPAASTCAPCASAWPRWAGRWASSRRRVRDRGRSSADPASIAATMSASVS